jgi:hypothetical protein
MEAMIGISLYNYLYLKLAKMLYHSYYLIFSIQQNQRTRGWSRFCLEAGSGVKRGGREVAQTVYTHVSKCKNDKIKTNVQPMTWLLMHKSQHKNQEI